MFRFAAPEALLLLPIVVAGLWRLRRRKNFDARLGVPDGNAAAAAQGGAWLWAGRAAPALKYMALMLMLLALAGPQEGTDVYQTLTEGVNIVIAVDASESMAALDFRQAGERVNRLEAVKGVVRDFVGKREGDRIGLVVFGDAAYTQTPLTRDYQTIVRALDMLEIGAAGAKTAIGDALGVSLKRLKDVESKSNVIILLTDGRSNAGEIDPAAAASIAAKTGVKVYTIGVGGREPAPFVVDSGLFGPRVVYKEVDIDEKTLRDIAAGTGGQYFRAEDTDSLDRIYGFIDELEKTEAKMKTYAEYKNLYPYFLGPAAVLLCCWIVLVNTRCLRLP